MANLEEETVLFDGEHLSCKKQFYDHGGFLRNGFFYELNYKNVTSWQGQTKFISKKVTKSAVIRRIRQNECLYNKEMIIEELNKKLDPNFVLSIYQFEDEKDQWRYFAIELFSCTLYHYCKGQYHGPELDKSHASFQILSAVNYIHSKGFAHGDLNPINIVIMSQHLPVRIKISDFGLSKFSYTKCESSDEELSIDFPEICKRKYWSMSSLKAKDKYKNECHTGEEDQSNPELISSPLNDIYPKEKDDVFAVGCIIFYLLALFHPFGNEDDPESILVNMKQKNMVNMKTLSKKNTELYIDSIIKMILQPKTRVRWLNAEIEIFEGALNVTIDKTQKLGGGSFGTVYRGIRNGIPVAIKEITLQNMDAKLFQREANEHILMEHENVLKLWDIRHSNDNSFLQLVLELCAGTLKDYSVGKYVGPMPENTMLFYQLTNGLDFIHSNGLVHRDLKPENLLISVTIPVQMKISDFGFVKRTENGWFSQSEIRGTRLWMAPEMLENLESTCQPLPKEMFTIDIFSLGLSLFFHLSGGFHAFFNEGKICDMINFRLVRKNIIENHPVGLYCREESITPLLFNLIGNMIKPKEERTNLPEVIKILKKELSSSRQFKEVMLSVLKDGVSVNRFHPIESILVCGFDELLVCFSAENFSIPCSNWKMEKIKLSSLNTKKIQAMEWNVDGTQLAAIFGKKDVIVWGYLKRKILVSISINIPEIINGLVWNPIRRNICALFHSLIGKTVFFLDSSSVERGIIHSCTIEHKQDILSLLWISEDRLALLLRNGDVDVYVIDESKEPKVVKQFKHNDCGPDMLWDDKTKYLATFSRDGCMKIWSMDSDQPVHTLKINPGCSIFSCCLKERKTEEKGIDAARIFAKNLICAGGMDNGQIVVWTDFEENLNKILNQHSLLILSLSFSPGGHFLSSLDTSGKLVIWSTENWDPVFFYEPEKKWRSLGKSFSWMSPSADVPEIKLTFDSINGKVGVIEYDVFQTPIQITKGIQFCKENQQTETKGRETHEEFSSGSYVDLK